MLCQSALGQLSTWADRVGPYLPQVPGAEFGLRMRWRLVLTSTGVPGSPLGIPPVVVFNLGRGVVSWGLPVAGQLSGTLMSTWLTHLTLCVPVLFSRGLSPSSIPELGHKPQRHLGMSRGDWRGACELTCLRSDRCLLK